MTKETPTEKKTNRLFKILLENNFKFKVKALLGRGSLFSISLLIFIIVGIIVMLSTYGHLFR